jgi:sirohydrochlorin cobaltochelatase
MPVHDAALLLLGHGSTLNADSSAPTYQHAEEIRRRNLFAEVHVAFWKEEPNFRQALHQTQCRKVYVVPNFISSGYFTEQVIPRELGLTGPTTHLDGQDIFYCQPVGQHPSMTEALLHRARQVVVSSGETIIDPAKGACLFICGHGTSLNDNSTKIIHGQAAAIRALGLYADCQAVLMEQKPFVKDWRDLTTCPDVVVVPFFISDGLHSFEDIPVLLGLTHNIKEKSFSNPHHESERRLWYATALGTDPFLADVILAQVAQFQAQYPETLVASVQSIPESAIRNDFTAFLAKTSPPWKIGQLALRPGFELLHAHNLDLDPTHLCSISSPEEWRDLIRTDDQENFRPLRAAPNLRRGWIYRAPDIESILLALDYFYPAELANWHLWKQGHLPATTWSETAERQTGRFRIVREIDELLLCELVAHHCETGCLKKRLWPPATQAIQSAATEIPLLCPEACNFLVEKARAKLKGDEEE